MRRNDHHYFHDANYEFLTSVILNLLNSWSLWGLTILKNERYRWLTHIWLYLMIMKQAGWAHRDGEKRVQFADQLPQKSYNKWENEHEDKREGHRDTLKHIFNCDEVTLFIRAHSHSTVFNRGGAQRSKVWLRIHFFMRITYFRSTESKSAFKTILSHQEVIFFSLATSITTP